MFPSGRAVTEGNHMQEYAVYLQQLWLFHHPVCEIPGCLEIVFLEGALGILNTQTYWARKSGLVI